MEYKLLIDGQWVGDGPSIEVKNKYNGRTVGVLPICPSRRSRFGDRSRTNARGK